MSAFVIIIRWRGQAPERSEIASPLATLGHRSKAGSSIRRGSAATIGIQRSWTTPEDVGVEQPVACASADVELVFDGRVDNRTEILGDLGLSPWAPLGDPELVARAVDRWGPGAMERLVGPGVLAMVDHRRRRVMLGRDALGDRTLVYAVIPGGLIVASEERAVLAHPAVPQTVDEESVARFLAVQAPRPGRTFFDAVREVPAGHILEITESATRLSRHWRPEELEVDLRTPDSEWPERLRGTLSDAVACRLRGTDPAAVLMSGGLDSTSVAAHAATLLGPNHRLHSISWIFEELEAADERAFIHPMVERFDLDASLIVGDGLWPLRGGRPRPPSPDLPFEGIYRTLNQTAHGVAVVKGTPILLTGEMGDQLFANGSYWLRDLVSGGRIGEAIRRSRDSIARHGPRGVRSAAARLLGVAGGGRSAPPWMTPRGAALVGISSRWRSGDMRDRAANVTDPFSCFGLARDVATAAAVGVEIRRPYRDRRLVELALTMPCHLGVVDGLNKWVLRQAGRGLLPEPVRLRRHHSTLLPLCARGFAQRGRSTLRSLLKDKAAGWRPYVSTQWVEAHLADAFPEDSIRTVAVWHCLTLDAWLRSTVAARNDVAFSSQPDPIDLRYNSASKNDYRKIA